MVNATETTSVVVNATKIRYSLFYDRLGQMTRGHLELQRADKRSDGTWMDDPTPGSCRSVLMPTSVNIQPLLNVLATVLGTPPTGDARLHVRSSLSATGVLDVSITVQIGGDDVTGRQSVWTTKSIPSLNAWLPAHMEHAQAIDTAWAALDAQIDAANVAEGWL